MTTTHPPVPPKRASGQVHGRGGRPVRVRATKTDHAALAARLTDRDKWILAMLTEHRVLTTTQLALLAFPSARSAQHRLAELYELGVIARFQPLTPIGSAPMHWVIDTPGAAVLAAQHPEPDQQPPTRRGSRHRSRRPHALAVAHSNQLRHQLGINTCLASLAAQTTPAPENTSGSTHGLGLWWSQTRCTHYFGNYIRPDAYAHWHTPTDVTSTSDSDVGLSADAQTVGVLPFFFEYDAGTEPIGQLAAKLHGYHQLAAATRFTTPVFLWLPSPVREQHARHALAAAHAALLHPGLVPVATTHTSPDPAQPHPTRAGGGLGLAGPVWAPLSTPKAPHQSSGPLTGHPNAEAAGRLSLDQLAQLWSTPCGHNHADHSTHQPPAPHPVPPPVADHPAQR